jgi:hypothetical protein
MNPSHKWLGYFQKMGRDAWEVILVLWDRLMRIINWKKFSSFLLVPNLQPSQTRWPAHYFFSAYWQIGNALVPKSPDFQTVTDRKIFSLNRV